MLTPDDIAEIRRRCEAATKGPWRWTDKSGWSGIEKPSGEDLLLFASCERSGWHGRIVCENPADFDFITTARTDIPALLAALAEHEAEVERMRGLCLQAAANIESNTRDIDADDHLIQSLRAAANADGGKGSEVKS